MLVVEGGCAPEEDGMTLEEAVELAAAYRAAGLSLKDAVRRAAEETGFSKNTLYDLSLGRN